MANEYSYNIDNIIDRDVSLGRDPVTITAHEITIIGDRQFVSGTIYYEKSGNDAGFFFEIRPEDRIEFPRGQLDKQRQALLQDTIPDIFDAKIEAGFDGHEVIKTEDLDNVQSHMRDAPEIEKEVVPDVVAAETPSSPEPANLKPGETIKLSDIDGVQPVLIPDVDIQNQVGDLVVHDIAFVDDKPFLTGTFSYDTPTGYDSHTFAIAIDAQRFPSVEELADLNMDQLKMLTSQDVVTEMVASRRHDFVLSIGEKFVDEARALEDINQILKIDRGVYAADMGYLVPIGQQHAGLSETLALYAHRADMVRSEEVLKLTVLDHVGVIDEGQRARLVYETGDLKDFYQSLRGNSAYFNAERDTIKAVEFMASHADELAKNADEVRDAVRAASNGAKFLRASGAVAGPTVTVASMAGTSYASSLQRGYAEDLLEREVITEDAYHAYLRLNIENNVLLGVTDGGLDWLGPVGQALSFPAEYRATQSLKDWADEYAPGLSDADFQTLAQGMVTGHTAKTEMLLNTAGAIPHNTEGQPEVWHDLIRARNEFFATRADAINQRGAYGGRSITQEQEEHFDRLDDLAEMAKARLITQMENFMDDPGNIEDYLNLLPEQDRLNYVLRLAESDPNPDATAAVYPEVAAYVAAYDEANIIQTRLIGFSAERELKANMDVVSRYIMDRSGLFENAELGFDELRANIEKLLTNNGLPEDSPPELVALVELQGNPDQQEAYLKELEESGMSIIVQRFLDQQDLGDEIHIAQSHDTGNNVDLRSSPSGFSPV